MSANWLQERLKKAEELLHAVDRTAKAVSTEIGPKPRAGEPPRAPSQQPLAPPASGTPADRAAGKTPAPMAPGARAGEGERPAEPRPPAASRPPAGAPPAAGASKRAKPAVPRSSSSKEAVAAALAAAEEAAAAAASAGAQPSADAEPEAAPPADAPLSSSGPALRDFSEPAQATDLAAAADEAGTWTVLSADAAAEEGEGTGVAHQQAEAAAGDDASEQQQQTQAAAAAAAAAVSADAAAAAQQPAEQPAGGLIGVPLPDADAAAGATSLPAADTGTPQQAASAAASDTAAAAEGEVEGEGEEVPPAGDASTEGGAAAVAQREARLLKMVDQLKRRLEQYKTENEQLEEMLSHADAAAQGGTGEISRLEDALAKAQAARTSAEAATAQALAAKAAEIQGLRQQLDAAAGRADSAESRMEELQAANERFVEERKASEGQLLQTLRREVEAIEQRLDEERAAHTATRKASAAREQQLDAALAESSSSMAAMQRAVEERGAKLSAAEERCYALEHEVEGLSQRLRAAETKLQRQAEAAAASSSEVLQQRVADLEAQIRTAQAGQQAAEQARSRADEELVGLRAEVGTLRRQLADASSVDSGELQRRLKDVTDMLYLKQTQLERLAADKAAQQLALERDLQQARSEAQQVKRRSTMDRTLGAAADESLVPMADIGHAYQRLANNDRVGGAVKAGAEFIDSTANQMVRILRQYPLGRLVIFAYVLGLHLFIYILLHRLQHKALRSERSAAALHRDERI